MTTCPTCGQRLPPPQLDDYGLGPCQHPDCNKPAIGYWCDFTRKGTIHLCKHHLEDTDDQGRPLVTSTSPR